MIFPNKPIRFFSILFILLVLFLNCAVNVSPVSAATIVVDTPEDQNNTDITHCSLREALYAAIFDTAYGGCSAGSDADIITLPAGVYTVDSRLTSVTNGVTINGAGAETTIIQPSGCNPVEETCANDYQLVRVSANGTLNLNNLTLRYWKNTTDGNNGGAILNEETLNISDCVFYANRAERGSALYNFYTGTMTVTNSTFLSNLAHDTSAYTDGGAIFNDDGTAYIEKSTFSDNHANFGGAIYNYGSEVTIINSTFSGNSAETSGGGLVNVGTATITNSTFFGNAAAIGAGIYNGHTYILNLTNTIIANSVTGDDCSNISGTIATNVNNLIEDNTCSPAFSGDPSLGGLAYNGGSTQTHALQQGSIAIDSGNLAACPATDQRGVTRPKGSGCDIGAFEFYPAVADIAGTPTSGIAPLEVNFTNNSMGEFDTCLWDFGDTTTSNECDPTPHTYTAAGLYTVSLTVSGLGGTDTKIRDDFITVHGPAVADFTGTPTSGAVPLEVDFTNNSTGEFDTCLWDFGDTTTSSDCNPSPHMYTDIGVYTVSLTVSGLGGSDTKIREDYIHVEEPKALDSFLPLVVK